MTKESPILFSGPMIRAILDGQKTMTRRVIKTDGYGPTPSIREHDGNYRVFDPTIPDHVSIPFSCPYGQPGDRLWVRETCYFRCWAERGDIIFKADGERLPETAIGGWRPSIHMPRWASRITLEITAVRVERLKSISNNDALAEGTPDNRTIANNYELRDCFRELWDSLNAKLGYGWDANPWVWVIEFKRIQK